jgi:hypothetical protein
VRLLLSLREIHPVYEKSEVFGKERPVLEKRLEVVKGREALILFVLLSLRLSVNRLETENLTPLLLKRLVREKVGV